ncbi:hypothetical protein GO497_21415 [Acidovorax citrulli]|nr:hypothetical protein [Paracidovorax citrulli]
MAKPVPHVSWFLMRGRMQRARAPTRAARSQRESLQLVERTGAVLAAMQDAVCPPAAPVETLRPAVPGPVSITFSEFSTGTVHIEAGDRVLALCSEEFRQLKALMALEAGKSMKKAVTETAPSPPLQPPPAAA